jgi:hypothetical protein
MLRLMKMTAYLLFGFFLYEAFRGISSSRCTQSRGRQSRSPGQPKTVDVDDISGAHRTQQVGRGVIS